jgi:hypothetical protein
MVMDVCIAALRERTGFFSVDGAMKVFRTDRDARVLGCDGAGVVI